MKLTAKERYIVEALMADYGNGKRRGRPPGSKNKRKPGRPRKAAK